MTASLKLYHYPLSGHAHRVILFAGLAGIEHEPVAVDLAAGEHKEKAFLEINPAGQVPALEDGDITLGDSNAILVYLARKFAPDWLPDDALIQARIQRFLSLAAGELRTGPANARLANVFGVDVDQDRTAAAADWVFARLEDHLGNRKWLAADRPTIADVAIYSYTAHAPEGGISLAPYAAIRSWLKQVEGLPGFLPMPVTKVGLAA